MSPILAAVLHHLRQRTSILGIATLVGAVVALATRQIDMGTAQSLIGGALVAILAPEAPVSVRPVEPVTVEAAKPVPVAVTSIKEPTP